jgi:hypothetical protein
MDDIELDHNTETFYVQVAATLYEYMWTMYAPDFKWQKI